jgi:hypothetical protein
MVNMYSMNSMGMGGMSGMMGSSGFSNNSNSTNVYQNFKAKYGVGYEDFGVRPYVQPYPMPILQTEPEPLMQRSWLGRFIMRCLN